MEKSDLTVSNGVNCTRIGNKASGEPPFPPLLLTLLKKIGTYGRSKGRRE
jgi:hypothetical protein